jgi:hypothetical protein
MKDDAISKVMKAIGERLDTALGGSGSVFVGSLDDAAAGTAKVIQRQVSAIASIAWRRAVCRRSRSIATPFRSTSTSC